MEHRPEGFVLQNDMEPERPREDAWQVVERGNPQQTVEPEIRPEVQEEPPKKKKGGFFKVLLVLAILAAGGAAALRYYPLLSGSRPEEKTPIDLEAFSVTAVAQDADGLHTDSGFLVEAPLDVTKDTLTGLIRLEPETGFEVKEQSKGEESQIFAIVPKEQLRSNTVYNLHLSQGDQIRSFAFQTKTAFTLSRTMPIGSYTSTDSGIELTFLGGKPVALEQAVTITPELEGRFERIRDSYVYLHNGMEPDTFYTVKVSGTLQSEGGATLGEDMSFSFRTRPEESQFYTPWLPSGQVSSVRTDQVPGISCMGNSRLTDLDYHVTVYRYRDSAGYINALEALHDYKQKMGNENCTLPTDGAEELLTFDGRFYESYNSLTLPLPDTLPEGYYLIRAICGEKNCCMDELLQVSDTVAYLISGEGRLVVWANDAKTGQPLAGVTVSQDGYSKGATDQNGLCLIDTPDAVEENFSYLAIETGETPFLMEAMAKPERDGLTLERKYYLALYTDRSLYLHKDEVRYWGVIQPRIGSVTPKELKVSLCVWDYKGETEWPYRELMSQTLTPGRDGVFSGSFSYEALDRGYYDLIAEIEGERIYLGGVEIADYEKPIYVIDSSSEKKAYDISEAAVLQAKASFFDGTPAGGLRLSLGYYNQENHVNQKLPATNAAGEASGEVRILDTTNDWHPLSVYAGFSNAQAEDAEIWSGKDLIFLPRDRMLETEIDRDAFGLTVTFSEINAAAFEGEEGAAPWNPEEYRGDPVSEEVTCTITEVTWHSEIESTRYDYLEKKNVYTYRYYTTEQPVDTVTLLPEEGKAHLDLSSYPLAEQSNFKVEITAPDRQGRTVSSTVNLYPRDQYPANRFRENYCFYAKKTTFLPGETLEFALSENYTEPLANPEGRVLLAPVTDTVHEVKVCEADDIALTMSKEHIPNAVLYGAYFDGRTAYIIYPLYLDYDTKEKELQVDVTADRDRYAPGDKVSLEISVTDRSGAPVAAQVLVSVVDDAALAVSGNRFDLLQRLYQAIYDAQVKSVVSHRSLEDFAGGAGGGGDGEGVVRSDFRDTPAFLTLATNKGGRASASIQLPDSLTRWHIAAFAVTEGASAGQWEGSVSAGLPFFVNVLSSDRYTAGDEVAVSLRAFGEELQPNAETAFTAELIREGETAGTVRSGSGKAGEYNSLSFGKQPVGSYLLRVSGKSGDLEDALELPLSVVESNTSLRIGKWVSEPELAALQPQYEPVFLTITDQKNAIAWEILTDLAGTVSARADRRVAAHEAAELLKKLAPELAEALPEQEELPDFGYGVSLLPTTESDALVTARIAAAAPELLPLRCTNYLKGVLERDYSSADDVAAAYLALASMKEPVLQDVHELLNWKPQTEGVQPWNLRQQLELAAALAAIGDGEGARATYQSLIRPLLEQRGEWLYVACEDEADQTECTALALLTASVAAPQDAEAMVRYLREDGSPLVDTSLEQLFYVRKNLPAAEERTVTVRMDGAEQEISLGQRGIATLSLTRQQLKTFEVTDDGTVAKAEKGRKDKDEARSESAGALSFYCCYKGSKEQLPEETLLSANLTRTVEPTEDGDFSQSGLLKVTVRAAFDESAPCGFYRIDETLPPCLRFVRAPMGYDYDRDTVTWGLLYRDGQHLSFGIFHDDELEIGSPETELAYYVRAVLPGSFVWEGSVLTASVGGLWTTGDSAPLQIDK
ncbi:MAG: hypothetical protein IJL39_00495 [Clostridia bacterium]|nr:hypothetical protein [Clostridia bacterium]